jgi:hypothetical protein
MGATEDAPTRSVIARRGPADEVGRATGLCLELGLALALGGLG